MAIEAMRRVQAFLSYSSYWRLGKGAGIKIRIVHGQRRNFGPADPTIPKTMTRLQYQHRCREYITPWCHSRLSLQRLLSPLTVGHCYA